MVKFYKIPVTERQISAEHEPLISILKTKWPALYNMETTRVKLMYEEKAFNKLKHHNRCTKLLYKMMGIPRFIIGVQEDESENVTEYFTATPLSATNDSIFSGRQVTEKEAFEYMEHNKNYETEVKILFKTNGKEKIAKR